MKNAPCSWPRKPSRRVETSVHLSDIVMWVGSVYEVNNMKSKEFPLFSPSSTFTDDTILTLAVADVHINGDYALNLKWSNYYHSVGEESFLSNDKALRQSWNDIGWAKQVDDNRAKYICSKIYSI